MPTMSDDNDIIQATIATAIQSARYNEAVVVTVNDNDGSPSEIVLVACLDPDNGGIIWKNAGAIEDAASTSMGNDYQDAAHKKAHGNVTSSTFREDPGIVRHLRTKKWALPMLNDHRRNHLYNVAVRDACRQIVKRRASEYNPGGSTDSSDGDLDETTIRILDIGSGTGLLAMMTARHTLDAVTMQESSSPQKVQVTSVEMASAMARLARMTIGENRMSENIVIVEQHSTYSNFGIDDARFGGEDTSHAAAAAAAVAAAKNGATKGKNINERADICTSELLESGLLGEGVLPSIRDAWTRHLKPDAIVVPRRARVFAVLVEGMPVRNIDGNCSSGEDTTLNAATAFLGPELRAFHEASGGVWMSTTSQPSPSLNETEKEITDHDNVDSGGILLGGQSFEGVTVPLHADAMLDDNHREKSTHPASVKGFGDFRGLLPLTDPTMVLDFDFASGLDAIPPPTGRSVTTTAVPTVDGTCHGVLFWWELDLWDGDKDGCTYSTEPIEFVNKKKDAKGGNSIEANKSRWQDHWQQCLFVFGDGNSKNGGTMQVTKASRVEIIASHDDHSISFSIETNRSHARMVENNDTSQDDNDSRPSQRRRLNEHDKAGYQFQEAMSTDHNISTTRALQLNDLTRIRTLRASIHHCIGVKGQDAPVLDISDFGLCAIIASVSAGAKKVTSLESSSGTLPILSAKVAQIGNHLPWPRSEFQIIQAQAEHILQGHIAGGAAEIVVCEPYYEMLEGWHLQEAMNYFHLIRSLKKRGVISTSALSVPAHARVMACVIEFDDFSSAYGRVGDRLSENTVAGFRHASVNYYGDRYHTRSTSFPLWQYRYKQLSNGFCVANILYEGAAPTVENVDDSVVLFSEGNAQAVVFWVDYYCRTGANFGIISTATSSHRQLVRKLPKPIAITEEDVKTGSKFCCHAFFDDDPHGIEDHSFTFEFFRSGDRKNYATSM